MSPESLLGGSLPLLDSSELDISRVSDHLAGEGFLILCDEDDCVRQYFTLLSGYTRLYLR